MVKKNIKLQSFSFSEIVYLPKLNLLFYKYFKTYLLSWGKKKKRNLVPFEVTSDSRFLVQISPRPFLYN